MERSRSIDKLTILLVLLLLLFLMSCASLTPIPIRTFSNSELPIASMRASANQLLNDEIISLLVINENGHWYNFISVDGDELGTNNVLKRRQWIVELLPGSHTITFDVDVRIDKKMKYYWSLKSKTCSFVAEPGHVYELGANRIQIFSWESLITDITEEYYKDNKLVYKTNDLMSRK